METRSLPRQTVEEIARQLRTLSPAYAPTPLLDLSALAGELGVAQILAKDEGRRLLGSFKSLGGVYAGLRALARAARTDVTAICEPARSGAPLPALICASDGNHGLAVACAARFAGASARVYLHKNVPAIRARRIEAQGAEIRWVDGAYDDAADAAAKAALAADGVIVADVMAGYGVISAEIRDQAEAAGDSRPTHLFVQAGVGGLACAMAGGLKSWMAA